MNSISPNIFELVNSSLVNIHLELNINEKIEFWNRTNGGSGVQRSLKKIYSSEEKICAVLNKSLLIDTEKKTRLINIKDDIVVYAKPTAPAIVKNCKFYSQLKQALYLSCGWFYIEDNYFNNVAYAIDILGICGDSRVIRNRISGHFWPYGIAVHMNSDNYPIPRGKESANYNVEIMNNVIIVENNDFFKNDTYFHHAIFLQPYNNVKIKNNYIKVEKYIPGELQLIKLNGCKKVEISNNEIIDERERIRDGIINISNSENTTLVLNDNQITANENLPIVKNTSYT